jgi:hypothetical protein
VGAEAAKNRAFSARSMRRRFPGALPRAIDEIAPLTLRVHCGQCPVTRMALDGEDTVATTRGQRARRGPKSKTLTCLPVRVVSVASKSVTVERISRWVQRGVGYVLARNG